MRGRSLAEQSFLDVRQVRNGRGSSLQDVAGRGVVERSRTIVTNGCTQSPVSASDNVAVANVLDL